MDLCLIDIHIMTQGAVVLVPVVIVKHFLFLKDCFAWPEVVTITIHREMSKGHPNCTNYLLGEKRIISRGTY